jgi:hypothetical protein
MISIISFQKGFRYLFESGYVVSYSWQIALNTTSLIGGFLGAIGPRYFADWERERHWELHVFSVSRLSSFRYSRRLLLHRNSNESLHHCPTNQRRLRRGVQQLFLRASRPLLFHSLNQRLSSRSRGCHMFVFPNQSHWSTMHFSLRAWCLNLPTFAYRNTRSHWGRDWFMAR